MGNSEFEDNIRRDEAERCALLCEMRGNISRASAAKLRKDGSYTARCLWPLFEKRTFVAPKWEARAQDMEHVAHAFDVVADCIRKGYDPRHLKDHEKSDEHMVVVRSGVDGDPSLHTIKSACYCDLDEAGCKAAGHPVSEQLKSMRC